MFTCIIAQSPSGGWEAYGYPLGALAEIREAFEKELGTGTASFGESTAKLGGRAPYELMVWRAVSRVRRKLDLSVRSLCRSVAWDPRQSEGASLHTIAMQYNLRSFSSVSHFQCRIHFLKRLTATRIELESGQLLECFIAEQHQKLFQH